MITVLQDYRDVATTVQYWLHSPKHVSIRRNANDIEDREDPDFTSAEAAKAASVAMVLVHVQYYY